MPTIATSANGPRVFVRSPRRWSTHARALRRGALGALAAAAPDIRGDLTIVLTTDAVIRRLNRDYRGMDRPTDVLSFELGDGARPGEPLGDVVISVQTAQRQARDCEAKLSFELLRLLVHGTLHLCGYDHHAPVEARRMHALTRRLLKLLAPETARA